MTAMLAWLLNGRALLMAIGFGVVITAVIMAGALLAETPGATIEGEIIAPATPAPPEAPQRYLFADGLTSADVAAQLEELGVIRSATQFNVLAALLGLQNRLASGIYTLQPGDSTLSILTRLTVSEVVPTVRITFPEGLRLEEMAEIAEQAGFGPPEEFLLAAEEVDLPISLAVALPEGVGNEGYLFPDTYILPLGSTAADLVALMAETLHLRFSSDLREEATARGLTPHEVLILASLVEREVAIPEERAVVAGVLLNRLAAFDRLGVDATVQYAIASDPVSGPASVREYGWWKPGDEITIADLDHPSPYNTRRYAGLPPGPIAAPGLAAIEAVVYAEDTIYYYYVIDVNTADGSHCFATSFSEHNDPSRCQKMER